MDASLGAASALTDRVSQAQSFTKGLFRCTLTSDGDRNVSGKWDLMVRDSNPSVIINTSSAQNNKPSIYFDARTTSYTSTNKTQYFEPDSGDAEWTDKDSASRQPRASFAEAETPPSTPRHRSGAAGPQRHHSPLLDISALDTLAPQDTKPVSCSPCSD